MKEEDKEYKDKEQVKEGPTLCCSDAGVWVSTGYTEKYFALHGVVRLLWGNANQGCT